ncbi:recombinase family protein [Salipaludibacillus aurantiacus]|uniref:Site-specific DNA recombinase n=1 Tax=Salipaludibacillus aurantiacus TaxID=1601833 RepID=A0A1H9ULU5_9BACI|nr:recombinase family protein [Salipaludibacillus aurantiacus]SES10319.1 Site-specific DNA recombinase [Salipaludibacillus aurantiacus]
MRWIKEEPTTKVNVFLRRVSTDNQSLEMQLAADEQYRAKLAEDEYIELNELGVSANKVKLRDREQMVKLISLIERKEVNTIYVYDRSRLTRSFYEYLELVDLFVSNNVEVIFTSTDAGYFPFSYDFLIEGFNGVLIEEEGKGISRRVLDNHRKLPPKKFGYDVLYEHGTKEYVAKPELRESIFALYQAAKKVEGHKDYAEFLLRQSKHLKKEVSDIARILADPFYTGSEIYGKRFSRLAYVEEIIGVDDFKEVQGIIKPYQRVLQENIEERTNENLLPPMCGICKKQMRYRKSKVGESGTYTCRGKGHSKVEVNVDSYNEMLIKYASLMINSLKTEQMDKKAGALVKRMIQKFSEQIIALDNKVKELEIQIATGPPDKIMNLINFEGELNELSAAKVKRKQLRENKLLLENYELNIKQLTSKVQNQVNDTELFHLIPSVVKSCYIHHTTAELNFYYNDYLDTNKLKRMVFDGR